jgi:hypothetical protein
VKNVSTSAFDVVAKVVFMDGTSSTVTIATIDGDDAQNSNDAAAGYVTASKFYTYTVKSNGDYKLTTESKQTSKMATADIKTGTVQPVAGYTANSETVYVNKDKVSVGVKNAPTIAKDETMYVLYNDKSVITAIYTATRGKVTSSSDSEYVYLLAYDSKNYDGDDYYYTYKAIVDGVKTTINIAVDAEVVLGDEETSYTLTRTNSDKGLYRIDGYEDDYVADLVRFEESDGDLIQVTSTVKGSISYKSGTVLAGSLAFSLTDDAELYVIDKTDSDKLTVLSSGSQLNSLSTGTYTIYVVKESDKSTADASIVFAVRTATK